VFSDPRGMRKYDDPRLISADALAERGERLASLSSSSAKATRASP
jgi:long-chain acyl-CoA synthetase